jgi:hypothetical protein
MYIKKEEKMISCTTQEILTLLNNRKQLLNDRLGTARQRGDISELDAIEATLLEIDALLEKLQS